jgi:hypothetical protein
MRIFPSIAAAALLGLAACGDITADLAGPVEPIGDFQLGFSEVVAPNLQKLLVSRDATEEEWIEAVDRAVERRFDRFEGGSFYHFGISVEGYSLPPPMVPGKSYLAIRVTVWDDSTQSKLDEEPKLIVNAEVFEARIARSREEMIRRLAQGAAREIEAWLREQQQTVGWFAVEATAEVEPTPRAALGAVRPVARPGGAG